MTERQKINQKNATFLTTFAVENRYLCTTETEKAVSAAGRYNTDMSIVRTQLKFSKSTRTGSWVGFVSYSQKSGRYIGVSESSVLPKKVCVVSKRIERDIMPSVLYDVSLVPMNNLETSYIVTAAEPHAFEAKFYSRIAEDCEYRIDIKFGNKTVVFNPFDGVRRSERTVEGVLAILEKRTDVKNLQHVIDEFKLEATAMIEQMRKDGYYGKDRRKRRVAPQAKAAAKA